MSHRYISYEKANKLFNINKKKTQYVGVLVKPSLEELEKFSQLNLDYFQLYGQYDNQLLFDIIQPQMMSQNESISFVVDIKKELLQSIKQTEFDEELYNDLSEAAVEHLETKFIF